MASLHFVSSVSGLFLIILISTPIAIFSQDPTISSSSPTIAECMSRLLPLAPCGPFVQGTVQSPPQPCCDNIKQIYTQQPRCLCLLLNTSTLSLFHLNTTLAMKIPALCSIQVHISTCPGLENTRAPKTNSTVAASPVVQVAPSPRIMGLGIRRSNSIRWKVPGGFALMMAAAIPLITPEIF